MSNLFDLKNKVAIVTGGNGVLGGAMSKGLADAGATVGIMGRTEKTVKEKVSEINEELSKDAAFPLVCDVMKTAQLEKVRDSVLDRFGRVDILINAAGGNLPGATINPDQSVLDLEDDAFEKVLHLNSWALTTHPRYFANQ